MRQTEGASSATRAKADRFRFGGIIAGAVFLCIVLSLAVGYGLKRLYDDALTDARHYGRDLAAIFAENVGQSSHVIESVLDGLISEVRRQGLEDSEAYRSWVGRREIFDLLRDRLGRLPQADVVTFTDDVGKVVNITRGWPTPNVNLADRDYFRHLSGARGAGLFISEPVQNKVTASWTIYFAKRVETADGRFLGVVLVGVRPEYFLGALHVVSGLSGRSLLLLRDDGNILLRHPDPINRTGVRIPADSDWFRAKDADGYYNSVGLFDSKRRVVGIGRSPRYPLYVNVSQTEHDALASWRLTAMAMIGVTFVVDTFILLLAFALRRQFLRLRASQAALSEKSRELGEANERFDAMLAHMSHGVAMFGADGRLLVHNRTYEDIWGLSGEVLVPGTYWHEIRAASPFFETGTDGLESDVLADGAGEQGEVRLLSDGRSIRTTVDQMPNGGWVTTHQDITSARKAQARISHLAHHDALTDLANRAFFMAHIQALFTEGAASDWAVLLLDLDRFKEVNDTFGHEVGDRLLQEVSARLDARADGAFLARLGGDEFAVVVGSNGDALERAGRLGDVLQQELARPYSIDGHEVTIGVSIGIAVRSSDAKSPECIVRRADLALYEAKTGGRNRVCHFEREMEEEYLKRQTLIVDLKAALQRGELEVHYQPIVDAVTLEICEMEALVRWHHPKLGCLLPTAFVAVAEESGLIQPLGEWVLDQACRDAVTWAPHIRLTVNASSVQIAHPSFLRSVVQTLERTSLPPRRLLLEVTESVLLGDAERALGSLEALRAAGVAVALDDFGTGYSSLGYIKRFPFEVVKIDRSFVGDLVSHRGSAAIVSATIALAREFEMTTTAEGVETVEQMELLRAAAVSRMQGWLFGRPAPASAWNLSEGRPRVVVDGMRDTAAA